MPTLHYSIHEVRLQLSMLKTDEERLKYIVILMNGFCIHCGKDMNKDKYGICYCTNDE